MEKYLNICWIYIYEFLKLRFRSMIQAKHKQVQKTQFYVFLGLFHRIRSDIQQVFFFFFFQTTTHTVHQFPVNSFSIIFSVQEKKKKKVKFSLIFIKY